MTQPGPPYDAIVLAGGSSRRLGGRDKAAVTVGGRLLLQRAVAAVAGARTVVVVGPTRTAPLTRHVEWTQESPAGGGPVAALAAGIAVLGSGARGIVALLAVDHPFVGVGLVARLVGRLSAAPLGVEAVIGTDVAGVAQPLVGAYRTDALRAAIDTAAPAGDAAGVPVRAVLGRLRVRNVPVGAAALDCDTPADIAYAEGILRGAGSNAPCVVGRSADGTTVTCDAAGPSTDTQANESAEPTT